MRNQRISQKERMSQSDKAFSWQRKNLRKERMSQSEKALSWQTQKEFEIELSHDRERIIESIYHDRESVEPNIETPMSSNSMAQLPSIQSSSTSTPPNGWEYL